MMATICRVVWAPRLAVFVADVVFGTFSLAVARGEPGYSFGGSSTFASAAELIAGCALLALGLIAPARPREARLGTILVAASIAWFVLEWNNPGASSAPSSPPASSSTVPPASRALVIRGSHARDLDNRLVLRLTASLTATYEERWSLS
jgi:hypothetical protein